jgi:hypothetical protein
MAFIDIPVASEPSLSQRVYPDSERKFPFFHVSFSECYRVEDEVPR